MPKTEHGAQDLDDVTDRLLPWHIVEPAMGCAQFGCECQSLADREMGEVNIHYMLLLP
jgi:hypothetical protein